ncbi:hypothetical protein TrLO_g17 [Triparma laevis f. longispina]|nr:hypothetical protein TrLO_g17 [Triparma laevis f. longispina]
MILDPSTYPTLSRARKACRKGLIIVSSPSSENVKKIRGRAANRITPSNIIEIQTRLTTKSYPELTYAKPPFPLPVIYQDSHIALVNKPSGVVTYSHRKGGHGSMTIRAALPHVLIPPNPDEIPDGSILRRPQPVHRLDKITSGIMVIAKTKFSMISLSKSFAERRISKSYLAILNGLPDDGGAVDGWSKIETSLSGKNATTFWKVIEYSKSLKADDNYVTLVNFKPVTGRYHQLRIHSKDELNCAIVGDGEYDGGTESAMGLRDNGMFLCSNRIKLPHPVYTSLEECPKVEGVEWEEEDGVVYLKAAIEPPEKFEKFMKRENERYEKFSDTTSPSMSKPEPEPEPEPSAVSKIFKSDKRPIILFDGVCNMCNSAVNLSLDWDTSGKLRFAALQSRVGKVLLESVGRDKDDISTIVLIEDGPEDYIKSDAVLRIGGLLAPNFLPVGLVSKIVMRIVPKVLRDIFYENVADNRYRILGKREECRFGDEEEFADRFVDDGVLE